MDHKILESELGLIDNYNIFRKDRNRHGGGVMLVFKSSIPVLRRYDLETDCELLWIEVCLRNSKMFLGGVYHMQWILFAIFKIY